MAPQRRKLSSKKSGSDTGSLRVLEIDLSELQRNPHQPRKTFDEQSLQELADSIGKSGLIQPIAVIDNGGEGYTIVAGERRYRAVKLLEWRRIPAIVLTGGNADELALVENVQRQDLHPLEEAEAMAGLMERHSYTQEELARIIGKARSTVTNTLKLNSLLDPIKEECSTSNMVTKSLLLEIAQLPADRQVPFWRAVKDGTTVRAARAKKGDGRLGSRSVAQLTLSAGRTFLTRLERLAEVDEASIDKAHLEQLNGLGEQILNAISAVERA